MRYNTHSIHWSALPWKKFQRKVFRLQKLIWKAVREDDKRKAKRLQKLIVRSRAAKWLAIRQVTQLNQGKKTAGIDGKKALNMKERALLMERFCKHYNNWEHQKLKEIPIPKKDGSKRILKVPTISDRAWPALCKLAIEPAQEATFHARSYGFSKGRSTRDVQKYIFSNLSKNKNGFNKRILELDIEKCFDRMAHTSIMKDIIAPHSIKAGLGQCLKAGTNPEFPEQGTPQGGVISPLLANIALNGIEEIHPSVRSADDMVVFLKPEDDADKILDKIVNFLATRKLKIKKEKTKVCASTDGFDFLGWNFKVKPNEKFICVPSRDNYQAFKSKVKSIVNNSNYGSQVKAQKLAPIVRGWRKYHQYCDKTKHDLWGMAYRTFVVFNKEKKNNRHSSKALVKKAFPTVQWQANKHIMVAGENTPFNGDFIYWAKRESKLYDGMTAKVLKKQDYTCEACGLRFMPKDKVELHHKDGNHSNWEPGNLEALHNHCHHYEHMSRVRTQTNQEPR